MSYMICYGKNRAYDYNYFLRSNTARAHGGGVLNRFNEKEHYSRIDTPTPYSGCPTPSVTSSNSVSQNLSSKYELYVYKANFARENVIDVINCHCFGRY